MHGTHPSKRLTIGEAKRIVGGLSFPTKMPGTSFSLPATACILGSKLAKIKGTTCSKCYALADRYSWPNARKAHQRRLAGLSHPLWIEAMVRLLTHLHQQLCIRIDLGIKNAKARGIQRHRFNEAGYHRWHDAGDLQSVQHFAMICEVARLTSEIKHWLPTNELSFVRQYLKAGGVIPNNLVIRVSSIMIDDPVRRAWPTTSEVFRSVAPENGYLCPAKNQGNECRSCRACWSADVAHVAYHAH